MKNKVNEKINAIVKAEATELAKQENTGYHHAEWLQGVNIEMSKDQGVWIDEQEKLGYVADDIIVVPFLSTHSAWNSWLSFRLVNKISKDSFTSSGNIAFPNEKNYTKEAHLRNIEKIELGKIKLELEKYRNKDLYFRNAKGQFEKLNA